MPGIATAAQPRVASKTTMSPRFPSFSVTRFSTLLLVISTAAIPIINPPTTSSLHILSFKKIKPRIETNRGCRWASKVAFIASVHESPKK
ncbi:MAG: hypothetical protein N3E47_06445 [Candidatus Bathyarchaeota archaeon]|nr:hypothetical protein [Candidatus Bathyarchaeota archaeon]